MCITEKEGIETAGYIVTTVSWKYDKYHKCGNTDNNYNSAGDSNGVQHQQHYLLHLAQMDGGHLNSHRNVLTVRQKFQTRT